MKNPKLYGWLAALAGLLVALLIAFTIWPPSSGTKAAITNLGKVAPSPRHFSVTSPGTWQTPLGTPRDWIDQGQDRLANSVPKPIGFTSFQSSYSDHWQTLRQSPNPADQRECRRLEALAKQWRENLLHRYPDLKSAPDTLPASQNAIRRLLDLAAKSGIGSTTLPTPLAQQLSGKLPWDSAAARLWLDHRRKLLEEIHGISGMQAGMNIDLITEWSGPDMTAFLRNCGDALCLEARYAVEQGNMANALESIKTVGDFGRALSDMRNPTLTCTLSGATMMDRARDITFQSILPGIPADQLELSAWEAALQSNPQTPARFSECMKSEWTRMMLLYILPALADPGERNQPPDPEYLVEAYTRYFSDIVRDHAPLTLGDLPSHPWRTMNTTGLSWRSQQLCQVIGYHNFRFYWERVQLRAGLTQAAFDILQGKPVPIDPFYGRPYQWNPKSRELSTPIGFEFKDYHIKPIKLPKL